VLELHRRRIVLIGRSFGANRDPATDQEVRDRGVAAVRELAELVCPFVEARRSGQGDDFISLLVLTSEPHTAKLGRW
jgi:hypothetical protein